MQDVFGSVMEAAFRGRPSDHQIERDDGFVNNTSGAQYVAPLSEWLEGERLAIAHAKGRVLDIGCGAGRVLAHLRSLGHDVTGIDISPKAVRICRERGLGPVYLMSAEHLEFPESSLDTVVLFGNNFGIMGTPNVTTAMFKEIRRVTAPDAVVLAGSRDPRATDDPAHLRYHQKNIAAGLPAGQVRIRIKYRGRASDWFWLLLSSPEEMDEIVTSAGWRVDRTYGPRSIYAAVIRKS